MYEKIAPVLNYFTRIEYHIASTNRQVKTESKSELLWLYNSARQTLNMSDIDAAGLHNKLKRPSLAFKRHLVYALGLDELGFGPSLWEASSQSILNQIKIAIDGGLVQSLAKQPTQEHLITVLNSIEQGIASNDPLKASATTLAIDQAMVLEEDGLKVGLNLPYASQVRILAIEDGEVLGLNEELDLPLDIIDAGVYDSLRPIALTKTIPKSVVVAIASKQQSLHRWPTNSRQEEKLCTHLAHQLFDEFMAISPIDRAIKMISVVTV